MTVRASTPGTTKPRRSSPGTLVAWVRPAPSSTNRGTPIASTTASPRRAVSSSSMRTCWRRMARMGARPGAGVKVPVSVVITQLRSSRGARGQGQVDVFQRSAAGVHRGDLGAGRGEPAEHQGDGLGVEGAGDRVLAGFVLGDPGLHAGGEAG